MKLAFILNFEESVDEIDSAQCGTQTITKTRNEQSDPDRSRSAYRAIPIDSTHRSSICPAKLGTQTGTRVRNESPDSDPSREIHRAVPRCS